MTNHFSEWLLCAARKLTSLQTLVAGVFLVTQAHAAGQPNPTLATMADNTWLNLNAPIESGTAETPDSGILAFSGMTYDSANHKILIFGGGHSDGYDDRVWSFDFATLQWTPDYASSGNPMNLSADHFDEQNYPGAIFDPVSEGIEDAHPVSLHTYDNLTFVSRSPSGKIVNEMFLVGASSYRGNTEDPPYWPKHPSYTWTYDHSIGKWTWRDKSLVRNNSGSPDTKGTSSQYDPDSGLVYIFETEIGGVWTYNIDTDSYTRLSDVKNRPNLGIEMGSAYANRPGDNPAVFLFGNEYSDTRDVLHRFDLKTHTFTQMPTGAVRPPVAGGYGLVYDSANDVLLAYYGGRSIWAYRFDINQWEEMATGPTNDVERVHGNFQYDPVDNVSILAYKSGSSVETWAYRYKRTTIDDTPPTAPGKPEGKLEGGSSVSLSWAAAVDAESGVSSYLIYRDGVRIAQTTALSFLDVETSESTSYEYRVSALNKSGFESNLSESLVISIPADTTPPQLISANSSRQGQVEIVFSEPVESVSAMTAANYSIDKGVFVSKVEFGQVPSNVVLSTSALAIGENYILSVSNVMDRAISLNMIAANSQASFSLNEPGSGLFPSNYEWGLLGIGEPVYIDDSAQFVSLPDSQIGFPYLRTADADKFRAGSDSVRFVISEAKIVSVAMDSRVQVPPAWLSDWTRTADRWVTSSGNLVVFTKEFAAGTVSLGGNEAGFSMYSVALLPTSEDTVDPGSGSQGAQGSTNDSGGGGASLFLLVLVMLAFLKGISPIANRRSLRR